MDIAVGGATLVGRNLERDGISITIWPAEAFLLANLAAEPGRTIPRHRLLRGWPAEVGEGTRVVDVRVQALRRALVQIGANAKIVSVRGVGYRLEDDREVVPRVLEVGDATLDLDRLVLKCGDAETVLSAIDVRLLKILATEPNGVGHTKLWQRARGDAVLVGRALDVHISRLRKSLRKLGSSTSIVSIRRFGYRLEVQQVTPVICAVEKGPTKVGPLNQRESVAA